MAKQAAGLITHINSIFPDEPVFGISLKDDYFIGVGTTSQLLLNTGGGEFWPKIDEYLQLNQGRWIAGYIGYDILNKEGLTYPHYPSVHLFSPDTVYKVSESNIACSLSGKVRPINLSSLNSHFFELKSIVSLAKFDDGSSDEFLACASRAYDWVIQGQEETRRMTVSRRIDLKMKFDLVQSIIPFGGEPETSISCYWRSDYIEFAGISPERTFYKESESNIFHCQKVSGTFAKDEDSGQDHALMQRFLSDKKNNNEHDISAANLINNVSAIGDISGRRKGILDLPNIRHFLTSFDVTLYKDKKLVDICKVLYPTGVQPKEDGLKKVFQFELKTRGPYYGIFFVQSPVGTVIGAHIIRMLFRDVKHGTCYTHCGACITKDSDLTDEYKETQLKLSSIVARI